MYVYMFISRMPTPPAHGIIAVSLFEDWKCEPGFAASIVVDLQRIFVCLDAASNDPDRKDDVEYLQMVAKNAAKFSSKIVLPMSANSEWRTVFFHIK